MVVGLGRIGDVGVVGAVEREMRVRGGGVTTGLKGKELDFSVKGNVGISWTMFVSFVCVSFVGVDLGASQMMSTRAADAGLGGEV